MPISQKSFIDPHRIQLRTESQSKRAGAVDLKTGRIFGVSLLTADREATGWGLWIDSATLVSFHALLAGRRLKAYATHGVPGLDGTLDEVGFWDGVRIDGLNLREDFTALDAWRRHAPAEFDTLFELAEKLPGEFGASLSFSYKPVWVLRDGTEVPTQRKFSIGGEVIYAPPAPSSAVRAMPSVRALDVYSADFVDDPAANTGLFSSHPGRGNFKQQPRGLAKYEARVSAQLAANEAKLNQPVEYQGKGTLQGLAKVEAAYAAKLAR